MTAMLVGGACSAQAGVLERCRATGSTAPALGACVENESSRAANALREANKATEQAVHRRVRVSGNKDALRTFRAMQAHHVRQRIATCAKRRTTVERQACEADLNMSHREKLQRFAE